MFGRTNDENIFVELISGDQRDEEETVDCSHNKTEISLKDAIFLINTLHYFVATVKNVLDVHLNVLDGLEQK